MTSRFLKFIGITSFALIATLSTAIAVVAKDPPKPKAAPKPEATKPKPPKPCPPPRGNPSPGTPKTNPPCPKNW